MLVILAGRRGIRKMLLVTAFLLLVSITYYKITRNADVPATAAPVYQGSAREKKIALTFNVFWGEEYIPQILEILKENKAFATFFLGGQWVDDFPDIARQIVASNHEVGNHSFSHPHPDRLSKSANIHEIRKAEEAIFKATGVKTVLFAPPYGERGETVLKASEEAGYTTILWSIDTIDWQRPEPEIIVRRVVEKAHNGAIILMHPTAPTVHALPEIIGELHRQGYELAKVSTLLGDLKNE